MFKAAKVNVFISTIDQITLDNVKVITCRYKSTDNYLSTLQSPAALQRILAPAKLIVLVLWPIALLYWISLTTHHESGW